MNLIFKFVFQNTLMVVFVKKILRLPPIYVILNTYLIALVLGFFFRLFMLWLNRAGLSGETYGSEIFSFFLQGARYDVLITSFIIIVPFILLVYDQYRPSGKLRKIAFYWILTGMLLMIVTWSADVPYYNKFNQHLTVKIFDWLKTPAIVFRMIIEEPKYNFMIIPGLIMLYLFYRLFGKIFRNAYKNAGRYTPWFKTVSFVVAFLLIFIGLRGSLGGHPLRVEDAFVFHNNLLNKLSPNPLFVFEKSIETAFHDNLDAYHYMDDEEAFALVRQYMRIDWPVNRNPISRYYRYRDSVSAKHPENVVIILMESMAAWKLKTFGNTENRTPFLDSLYRNGLAFSRMYSAGIHTHVGVYATLVSYPVIYDHHPMRGLFYKKYYGLPQILKEKGYHTLFFMPHSKAFDNLGAFLSLNGFDKIYYDKDYPSDKLHSVWGTDDDFLLQYAIRQIDTLTNRSDKPFMATILTVSDHRPFYIPDFIKGDDEEIRATRFADYALKSFFEKARKKPWFKNTLFVFAADHGETHHMVYPVPLTYNHMAAIFYHEGITPRVIDKAVSQLDISPTIMHILGMDYLNMNFGLDALIESRPYVIFNHDNLYGVLDDEFFLVVNRDRLIGLYRYKTRDKTNYARQYPEKAEKMNRFLQAHIQTAAYILKNNLQDVETVNAGR